MNSELKLYGALARIQRRSRVLVQVNEFDSEPLVDFTATRRVVEKRLMEPDHECVLELRIGASYNVLRGDCDELMRLAERTALRSLVRVLYQDVVDDLLPIMKAVSGGHRRASLALLNTLFARLNGVDDGE